MRHADVLHRIAHHARLHPELLSRHALHVHLLLLIHVHAAGLLLLHHAVPLRRHHSWLLLLELLLLEGAHVHLLLGTRVILRLHPYIII